MTIELPEDYLLLKNRVAQQNGVIERMQEFVNLERNKLKEMLQACPHLELVEEKRYDSGSYYDKASTTYWHRCTLCNAKSEPRYVQHSYYG